MSKKYFTTAFLLTFLFFAFSGVSAQENTFTQEDLTALRKTAAEKIKDKPRRVTSVTVFYKNGVESANKYRTISETIPPDREHFVSETITAAGVERYEFIRVGERRFTRDKNGEWRELTGAGGFGGIGGGSGGGAVKIEKTVERKLKKGETINNQNADLYETTTVTKLIYSDKTIVNTWKESNWFDKNGLFIKVENEHHFGETNSVTRDTRDYEYDPKDLKIEAPIKP